MTSMYAYAHQIGVPANPDYNGEYQEGASHLQTTTSPHRERWSASSAYIWPYLHKRKNLEVVTNANVARVLLECSPSSGKGENSVKQEECVATGVILSVGGREKVISARKQVVVTASAVFTPKVLMLSGRHDREYLHKHA
jgi:choline dehydrogenase-like flavoprotein